MPNPPIKEDAFVTQYEGHAILNIPLKPGQYFRFGIGKACKIIQYLDDINIFVNEYDENRIKDRTKS